MGKLNENTAKHKNKYRTLNPEDKVISHKPTLLTNNESKESTTTIA